MDLDFSAEQKMLGDQAQRFLSDKEALGRSRSVLEGDAPFDRELWQEMAQMGWLGTAIPEAYGGVGMGALELCVLAEQLGRSLAPVPFSSTLYLFSEALLAYGSEEQKQRYLPQIAEGKLIGTVAVVEETASPTENSIECAFANGKLDGCKIAVPDGDVADVALVLARQDKVLAMYLVDLNDQSVRREQSSNLDGSRSFGRIEFSSAPAELVGQVGQGWNQWQKTLDRAAVFFAFEQLGLADSTLEMAKNYALERHAFGRPIASYQAVKHRLADMYIGAQLARSNCYYAAWALSTHAAELPVAAAGARIAATQASEFNSKENIQLHGGMGFTWEFDCHLYYRRSKVQSLVIGALPEWQNRLMTALEESNLPK
ncbi:MAG: acyl-CoA dehydrogenase family protein [Gammaproteobacteria bacterium]